MCNRMDELRQCSSTIGRLQIPAAGQMGKYSYNNNNNSRHHRIPSSSTTTTSASSIITRSYTPSQTESELSILSSTSISRPKFSDIEEEGDDEVVREDDFVDNNHHLIVHNGHIHRENDVKKLIDNYQSKIADNNNPRQATTMGFKIIQQNLTTTATRNNDNDNGQSKIKCSGDSRYIINIFFHSSSIHSIICMKYVFICLFVVI